jgi:DnaK suppressor protein
VFLKLWIMTAEEKQYLKGKIESTIVEMKEKIRALVGMTQPISPENSIGRVSRMDAINNKGVADAAMLSAKKRLANLHFAYSKLDDPNFGKCSSCGNPIQTKRLMFMPESTRCVRCADRR